ncbi:MAG: GerAB/ArcD/ProY family transporter, partial [Firmicutes bacterium]|nr:GerAB/ArcD/ProY family transporter [Bacillota bacterium]
MEIRNQITAKQLGIIILSAQVGAGVIVMPAHLAKEVGSDGWISILGAGLLSTIVIVMIIALLRKYAGQSILEINRHLFGKILGQIINLLLIVYLSFLMVTGLRYFTEFIQLFTLEVTPGCIVALLIITPTAYLTWYGLKPVARFSYIMLFVLFSILLLGFMLWKNTRLTFLMPVGAANLTVLSKSIVPTFLSFIGFELVVFLYPYVRDQQNALKWVVASNLCTMLFFLITFLIVMGIFGENHLKMQVAPLFNLSRYYRVPYIGRVDLLFILIWFPFLESTFRSYFFTAYDSIRRLYPSSNQKFLFGCFLVLTILLSRLPKDFLQTAQLTSFVGIVGITVVGFIFFCYLYSFFKKKGQASRVLILLITVGSLLLFSGCWDQKRIEQTGILLQMGIELSPEQKLLVTSIYPAVDAKEQKRDEIITAEGDLLREARNRQ